jgi:hypothetical protein
MVPGAGGGKLAFGVRGLGVSIAQNPDGIAGQAAAGVAVLRETAPI